MNKNPSHARIYKIVIDTLIKTSLHRPRLIESCLLKLGLSENELSDNSVDSKKNRMRSSIGAVINEMHAGGLIAIDDNGRYYAVSTKPVIIRIEKCQKEIIKALSESPMTKFEIKNRLVSAFGTDKTATNRDDDILATYIGQLLKRMLTEGIITLNNGVYALTPKISARADDINEILTLKSEFILRLHSKGGEFFENYFMTLLKKYMEKHGRRILECYVVGGSEDGGIDGIIKTEECLGFRETIMVQTKNRTDLSTETDLRGFYGAVCAKQGSRGIYATTADFHPGAKNFVDPLDDCVGVNGDKIFSMACECLYGIKKSGNKFIVDTKTI